MGAYNHKYILPLKIPFGLGQVQTGFVFTLIQFLIKFHVSLKSVHIIEITFSQYKGTFAWASERPFGFKS